MWHLSVYEKQSDRLVKQHRLFDVDVGVLRALWHQPDGDPMYHSYPVTPVIAEALRGYVSETLQLDEYDYFLEYGR